MHRWCKSQKPLLGPCTTGANRKNYYLTLAPSLQTEKTAFGPLHRWCKSQKPLLGPCTDGASRKKYFLVVAPPVQAFPKTFWPSCDFRRNSLLALFLHRTHVRVNAFSERQNETRDRSRTLRNAFPPRETDQNFWKRQNEAGNRSKSPKSHFLRRETGKILRKVISRGGKGEKCFGKRLRAAGRRLKVPEIGFARREKEDNLAKRLSAAE